MTPATTPEATPEPQSETVDRYPSRVASEPDILPRVDPVVYGDNEVRRDGPLTRSQLNAYERDGFLILSDFLSQSEVDVCRAELDRLRGDDEVKARQEAIIEPESRDLRSLFCVHRLSPLFADVASDERIAGMAMQILDSDVYIHQSRVNLKPGFVGKEFYWHSDFETWHVEDGMPRMRAVSFSILLTPNNAHNGPLMLIPGSHRHYVACVGETPEEHYKESLKRQEYGVPDTENLARLAEKGGIEAATGKAGSLVLFDCNTMHGSNGNITPWPRSNLFFVYNSVENRLCEPYCGLSPRPEHIGAREHVQPITPQRRKWAP